MNPILSVKLILCFNLRKCLPIIFLLNFFIQSVYSAEILTPKELSPELIKEIEKAVEIFQKPLDKKEFKDIVSKTKEEVKKALSQNGEGENFCADCPESQTTVYYFFSFSMPEEVILRAMRDAIKINEEGKERVSLVLRGFVRNDLRATINELYKYLQMIGDDIPVEVDPESFERFRVTGVPQVLGVRDGGKIGVIKGDLVSLPYALSKFAEELKDYGLFGKLYPIREENAFKVLASKQKEVERGLRERIPQIKKRMVILSKYDGLFEHAKEDRVYYIDPRVMLEDDIYDHRGNIIVPAGTVFDPTEYVKLGRYVVIDGNSKKQVEFALNGDFRKIIIISGNIEELINTYKKPFYFANDELIERFQIKRVPAIIEGEGKYVKVTEKALK